MVGGGFTASRPIPAVTDAARHRDPAGRGRLARPRPQRQRRPTPARRRVPVLDAAGHEALDHRSAGARRGRLRRRPARAQRQPRSRQPARRRVLPGPAVRARRGLVPDLAGADGELHVMLNLENGALADLRDLGARRRLAAGQRDRGAVRRPGRASTSRGRCRTPPTGCGSWAAPPARAEYCLDTPLPARRDLHRRRRRPALGPSAHDQAAQAARLAARGRGEADVVACRARRPAARSAPA